LISGLLDLFLFMHFWMFLFLFLDFWATGRGGGWLSKSGATAAGYDAEGGHLHLKSNNPNLKGGEQQREQQQPQTQEQERKQEQDKCHNIDTD
jgi:hypothetical protein